jgi:hypothetical protein
MGMAWFIQSPGTVHCADSSPQKRRIKVMISQTAIPGSKGFPQKMFPWEVKRQSEMLCLFV